MFVFFFFFPSSILSTNVDICRQVRWEKICSHLSRNIDICRQNMRRFVDKIWQYLSINTTYVDKMFIFNIKVYNFLLCKVYDFSQIYHLSGTCMHFCRKMSTIVDKKVLSKVGFPRNQLKHCPLPLGIFSIVYFPRSLYFHSPLCCIHHRYQEAVYQWDHTWFL